MNSSLAPQGPDEEAEGESRPGGQDLQVALPYQVLEGAHRENHQ